MFALLLLLGLLLKAHVFGQFEQRPEKPYNVTVKQNRHGLLISWMGPKDDDRDSATPLSYTVQYRTVGQWVPLISGLTGKTSFNWTTASRGATYHFRIISNRMRNNDYKGSVVDDDDDEILESLPSDTITVQTGDPMNEGLKVSDEMIGAAIGGLFLLLILLAVCMLGFQSFRRCQLRNKALKGHALATSDPDPEPFTENHLDIDSVISAKSHAVKETPI